MNVLALGAHPLDIVLLAGGTLARYAFAGHTVAVAYMCSPGSESPDVSADDLTGVRVRETQRAAALIGASVHPLGFPICGLHRDEPTKLRLAELIRRVEPHLILTHDPDDYHIDHEITSLLAAECAFIARQQGIQTQSPPTQVHSEILFMDTISGLGFEPDEYVDITDVFDTKIEMMRCYESEITAWQDDPVLEWLEWAEVHSRYRGLQASVRYAEAFRRPHKWGHMPPSRMLP